MRRLCLMAGVIGAIGILGAGLAGSVQAGEDALQFELLARYETGLSDRSAVQGATSTETGTGIAGAGRAGGHAGEGDGVAIGTLGNRTYAFVGLEHVGGIMAFDITGPEGAAYAGHVTGRDLSGALGPEGLVFIPAAQAPGGAPLLAVGNEVSGSTAIYRITR